MSEALHINSGRLLCKYLAEEWDFSYNFDNEDSSEASVMHRIRPWNAMMLISNDIMRYAEESDDGNIQNIDVNAMEKHANQYISQQIFNILTAQAVTTDYDQNYFRRAGKGRFRKAPAEIVQQALAAIEKKKQVQAQIEAWAAPEAPLAADYSAASAMTSTETYLRPCLPSWKRTPWRMVNVTSNARARSPARSKSR